MPHPIHKVAVLGAGVMGAQIAALLANAKFPVALFDLETAGDDKNALIKKSLERLKTLQPAPLTVPQNLEYIQPANYLEHLPLLAQCDWIIEAIAERLDLKQALYQKISNHISPTAFVSTNTSGISIGLLSKSFSENLRTRFCGTHFFNPPRYMFLVELIAHSETNPDVVKTLEELLVSYLGKGVVHAKDTPNFIANRVGVFSILSTLRRAEEYQIPIEVVDQLTGQLIGRAKSATYRTIDVVGLDTLSYVVEMMGETLKEDPWQRFYKVPETINQLIKKGAIGQKTGKGFYQKGNKGIEVYNFKAQRYEAVGKNANSEVLAILKEPNLNKQFSLLRNHPSSEAKFLWSCFSDLFHYCSYHLATIAETTRDVDEAMRWGYGWKAGPFEIWQKTGWHEVGGFVEQDIAENKALTDAALPSWIKTLDKGVYIGVGSFNPAAKQYIPGNKTGIYQRQYFPEPLLNETVDEGHALLEMDAIRLWKCGEDDIGILSFKTKFGTIGQSVLDGINAVLEYAERSLRGVVIWQRAGKYFSAGADLKEITGLIESGKFDVIDRYIQNFQKTTDAVKYATIPVVAAIQGYAVGGGCEFMMHTSRVIAASETYAGLVETGVGLIPAGGGCKEWVRRVDERANGDDVIENRLLKSAFWTVFYGRSSQSAEALRCNGYLRPTDEIILNPFELLYVAKQQVLALSQSCYRPPMRMLGGVVGEGVLSELLLELQLLFEKGKISEHDKLIGTLLAEVFCGGRVKAGTLLSESALLDLERNVFLELIKTKKTQERIVHVLKTGKGLRN